MVGIITDSLDRNRALDAQGVAAIPSSTGEVASASFEESLVRNPTATMGRQAFRDSETALAEGLARDSLRPEGQFLRDTETGRLVDTRLRADAPEPKMLSPDEANDRFGIDGKLTFSAPVADTVAQQLNGLKRDEQRRQDVFRRAQGGAGQFAASAGAGLVASILDPLNVASAFVPVAGPARYGLMLERAGSAAARAAVRLRVGAVEGAAGAAALEPFVYGGAKQEQADYTAVDSLLNIAFGTVLGGGLHAAAGAIGDRITGFSRTVENLPGAERENALRSAIAQVVDGRPVDVDAFFLRQELLSGTSLAGLRRQGDLVPERLAGAESQAVAPAPSSVFVPMADRVSGFTRYDSAEEAGRVAARLERRTGENVDVRQTPEGAFVLVRETAIEPIRNPDGTPNVFQTERQAQRFVDQQLKGEKVDIVRAGPTGERGFAILRNATPDDLKAIRAEPSLVDLGRSEDRSAATSVAADRAKASEVRRGAAVDLDRKVRDLARQNAAGYIDPRDLEAAASILNVSKRATATRSNAENIRWSSPTATEGAKPKREPIATIRGDEIGPGGDVKTLRQRAREWYDTHLLGKTVRSEALGADVEFSVKSRRKAISTSADPDKLRLFAAIPDIIKKGELVGSRPPETPAPNIRMWHYLRGVVKLGNEERFVTLSVREETNGHLYYNHVLTDEEGRPLRRAPEEDARKANPGDATGGTAPSGNIGRSADDLNMVIEPIENAPKMAVSSKAISDAQALLDGELQRLDAAQRDGRITGENQELTEADALIEKADSTGRAYDAAAACIARRS